jgi:hypothetical protein
MNMKFIKIGEKIYSTAIIQRLSLNRDYITFFILDGVKPKQIDVKYSSQELSKAVFNDLVSVLKDQKEIYEMNPE